MISEEEKARLLVRAEKVYAAAIANGEQRFGRIVKHAFEQLANHNNPAYLRAIQDMRRVPVTIDEFIESPDFAAPIVEVWPTLRETMRQMNPDQLAGEAATVEVLMGGATGWGKTECAKLTTAYQVYVLTCFNSPQALFGLSKITPIVFMFASVSSTVTNRVIYKPFRDLFLGMRFSQKYLEYNTRLESSLALSGNIIVVPALASVQAMVGQAIVGAIMDEVNFMATVENSRLVTGAAGQGGYYDQAEQTYRNLSRRRKSRFITRGPQAGALCILSSTRYVGDFLDRRIAEVEKVPEPGTLALRHDQPSMVPPERFCGQKFRLLVGTDMWPTKILDEHDVAGKDFPEQGDVREVPVEYMPDFRNDPENALRDVIGIATRAITPFIAQRDRIIDCVSRGRELHLRPILSTDEIVLARGGLPPFPENFKIQNPNAMRFIHIDLATTSDRCGVAVLRHDGYVKQRTETLPIFSVELAVGIKPDTVNQLQIAELREWILQLIRTYRLNVVQVSYDTWNSKESIQTLRRAGIRAVNLSVDRTPEPYEVLRQAIYDLRVLLPNSELLRQELVSLEWLAHKNKVDHPVKGCFTGETRVALADGSLPTFAELARKYGPNDIFYVYAIGPEGVTIAPARNPRITKQAAELVEVTLDNFQVIRCTPDHLFMTLDREWVRAENLTPDISLMPLYRSRANKGGWAGYERIYCPVRKKRMMTHQLAVGGILPGQHVHHKDGVKHNNAPENLEILDHKTHTSLHAAEKWDARREAMQKGFDQYFADPVAGEASRQRILATWERGGFGRGRRGPCAIEACERLTNARGLCDMHYQRAKRRNALPSRTGTQQNHRVLSVTRVLADEPVYDLTVPGLENFALASGVFVHNSKDIADAVAGALYAATRFPAIRSRSRIMGADGKPIRAPFSMARPKGGVRPSSANRPSRNRQATPEIDLLPDDDFDFEDEDDSMLPEGDADQAPVAKNGHALSCPLAADTPTPRKSGGSPKDCTCSYYDSHTSA